MTRATLPRDTGTRRAGTQDGTGGGTVAPAGTARAAPGSSLRRWRSPLGLAAVVLLGGALTVLLRPSPSTGGYLDPGNTGAQGTRALADLLDQRGQEVTRVDSVPAARKAMAGQAATLVLTSPYQLTQAQLGTLARLPGNLMVVEPDSTVLSALTAASGVRHHSPGAPPATPPPSTALTTAVPASTTAAPTPRVTVAGAAQDGIVEPGCALAAATEAGNARMGGVLMRAAGPGGWRCYPVDGHPSLVQYTAGGRSVTLLGSGEPLTNQYLASGGDAALALNLLRGRLQIVWLMPSLPTMAPTGPKSLLQEIPGPAYLVALQLLIAIVAAAVWRGRRLGPLVTEPLPVVIRASETVEGHGRLYRSRRSRDRAAAVLRSAALNRITTALALPPATAPDAACAAIADRAGRDRDGVRAILFGPVPRDDAALVALGRDLDRLEGEVRTP